MNANPEITAQMPERKPEQDALVEKSTAPTLRDLRSAAKNLFTTLLAEPDSVLAEIVRADCRPCLPESNN